jgi:hypothetical protein
VWVSKDDAHRACVSVDVDAPCRTVQCDAPPSLDERHLRWHRGHFEAERHRADSVEDHRMSRIEPPGDGCSWRVVLLSQRDAELS